MCPEVCNLKHWLSVSPPPRVPFLIGPAATLRSGGTRSGGVRTGVFWFTTRVSCREEALKQNSNLYCLVIVIKSIILLIMKRQHVFIQA